jgi:hypothetical protein
VCNIKGCCLSQRWCGYFELATLKHVSTSKHFIQRTRQQFSDFVVVCSLHIQDKSIRQETNWPVAELLEMPINLSLLCAIYAHNISSSKLAARPINIGEAGPYRKENTTHRYNDQPVNAVNNLCVKNAKLTNVAENGTNSCQSALEVLAPSTGCVVLHEKQFALHTYKRLKFEVSLFSKV